MKQGACTQEERRGREDSGKRKGKGASLFSLWLSLVSTCNLKVMHLYVIVIYPFLCKACHHLSTSAVMNSETWSLLFCSFLEPHVVPIVSLTCTVTLSQLSPYKHGIFDTSFWYLLTFLGYVVPISACVRLKC